MQSIDIANMADQEMDEVIDRACDAPAWRHPLASVIGATELGPGGSIWPGAVLRGDSGTIRLGRAVNFQDRACGHTEPGGELVIGDYALIGHGAILHGCRVGAAALVGINCLVLDEAEIGAGAIVTAGVLIRGRKKIPPRSLVTGFGDDYKIFAGKANPQTVIEASLSYAINGWLQGQGQERFVINERLNRALKNKSRTVYERLRKDGVFD